MQYDIPSDEHSGKKYILGMGESTIPRNCAIQEQRKQFRGKGSVYTCVAVIFI